MGEKGYKSLTQALSRDGGFRHKDHKGGQVGNTHDKKGYVRKPMKNHGSSLTMGTPKAIA